MKEQESYSVDAVKKIVGCTSGRINDAIFAGRIKLFQNRVSALDMKNILQEKETYISLYDYAVMNSSDRFNGKSQKDRNNLMDYLEQQEFFGIEFCEVEDMSYEKIADILKCPVGTVKSRLNRARKALKKKLSENRELFL